MSATNSNSNDSGSWQPCPTGELSRVAVRLRGRRRNRMLAQAVTACTVLFVVAGGTYLQFGPRTPVPAADSDPSAGPEGFNYGGITCAEMHRVAPALKEGTLDDATLARFRRHVELCPHCKSFRRLLPEPHRTSQVPCDDPNCTQHAQHVVWR